MYICISNKQGQVWKKVLIKKFRKKNPFSGNRKNRDFCWTFFLIFCSHQHLATPTHPPCQQTSAIGYPTHPPLCWCNTWMVPYMKTSTFHTLKKECFPLKTSQKLFAEIRYILSYFAGSWKFWKCPSKKTLTLTSSSSSSPSHLSWKALGGPAGFTTGSKSSASETKYFCFKSTFKTFLQIEHKDWTSRYLLTKYWRNYY